MPATWATSWSTTLSSPGWRRFADAGADEEDWPNQGLSLNSIAASLFENNLVELTNSGTTAATPSGAGAKSLRSLSSLETGSC